MRKLRTTGRANLRDTQSPVCLKGSKNSSKWVGVRLRLNIYYKRCDSGLNTGIVKDMRVSAMTIMTWGWPWG